MSYSNTTDDTYERIGVVVVCSYGYMMILIRYEECTNQPSLV